MVPSSTLKIKREIRLYVSYQSLEVTPLLFAERRKAVSKSKLSSFLTTDATDLAGESLKQLSLDLKGLLDQRTFADVVFVIDEKGSEKRCGTCVFFP